MFSWIHLVLEFEISLVTNKQMGLWQIMSVLVHQADLYLHLFGNVIRADLALLMT